MSAGTGSGIDLLAAALGQSIRVNDNVRPSRYGGRTGTIVSLNVRNAEVGVWLDNYGSDGHRAVTWFRPPLEVVAVDTATTARQAPVLPSRTVPSTDLAEQAS